MTVVPIDASQSPTDKYEKALFFPVLLNLSKVDLKIGI